MKRDCEWKINHLNENMGSHSGPGRKKHRGPALSETESQEPTFTIEKMKEYINCAVSYPEYGLGIVTQFWADSKKWRVLFPHVSDWENKTCPLGCETCINGQLHCVAGTYHWPQVSE